jgi:hypothetical protein
MAWKNTKRDIEEFGFDFFHDFENTNSNKRNAIKMNATLIELFYFS